MATERLNVRIDQAAVAVSLNRHWRMFLTEGIVLLVLGLFAIVLPPIATLAVEILVGWLLLASGIMGLISTFRTRGAPGFALSLVSALIALAAGIVLLTWPLSGTVSLTLVVSVFLLFEGVVSIALSLRHRADFSGRWTMLLLSGIVDGGRTARPGANRLSQRCIGRGGEDGAAIGEIAESGHRRPSDNDPYTFRPRLGGAALQSAVARRAIADRVLEHRPAHASNGDCGNRRPVSRHGRLGGRGWLRSGG